MFPRARSDTCNDLHRYPEQPPATDNYCPDHEQIFVQPNDIHRSQCCGGGKECSGRDKHFDEFNFWPDSGV
jgi:hypothetical protein